MKGLFLSSFFLLFLSLSVNANVYPRDITPIIPPPPTPTPPTSSSSSTTANTDTTASTSSSSSATSASPTTSTTSSTTSSAPTTSAAQTSATSASLSQPPLVVVTESNGVTVTVTSSTTSASGSASAAPTSANDSTNDSSSGLGTGSIIGLAVAGGVAVIGIIAFFVWKFTRKRFSDFDDNEAIKWPDLNTHGAGAEDSHPLPVKNTGRSGFDTGSEGSLSRVESNNYSTADFNSSGSDPYAVPPLPHLNPNQPYRDDPGAVGGGYYDPYRGPIPGTIEQGPPGGQAWGGEAIPMTQMNASGRMSPGPNAAYGVEPAYDYNAGRQSPGPQVAYGGRSSPGPQAAYGGRMSPGPHAAYGGAVSPTPGPTYSNEGYGGR